MSERNGRKRWVNCVVLASLHKPGVIWRFFRRRYFAHLNKEIEQLPKVVKRLGNRYIPAARFLPFL